MEVVFTDRFLSRVEEYSDYIALDDIQMAIKWARGVFELCEKLSLQPKLGRMVPEFGRSEIREIIHGNYRLVYELKKNQVYFLTVWHTKQRFEDDEFQAQE